MSLTLATTDNRDGTGMTAAVAGSSGGSVTVWAMPMADNVPFALIATRTGNGTLPLPLLPHLYWLYAAEGAAVTPVQGGSATDGLAKTPTRCRAAVAARVRTLGLTDPSNGRPLPVHEQLYPDETGVQTYPCVILSVEGSTETVGNNGTFAADDKGYPVKLMVADRLGSPPDHSRLPVYEAWRYAIERAFDGQYLPGVPESAECKVEPYLIADPAMPQYQHFQSGMLIRCFCRVPRGLGV